MSPKAVNIVNPVEWRECRKDLRAPAVTTFRVAFTTYDIHWPLPTRPSGALKHRHLCRTAFGPRPVLQACPESAKYPSYRRRSAEICADGRLEILLRETAPPSIAHAPDRRRRQMAPDLQALTVRV